MAYSGDAREDVQACAIDFVQWAPDDLWRVFFAEPGGCLGEASPPDDADLPFFGSDSPGRARRMLDQREKTGAIVVRKDFQRLRIIAFPELGVQTDARRDANAIRQDRPVGANI